MGPLQIIREDEKIPLIVRKIDGIDTPVILHFHQNFEISYILRGGNKYMIDDEIYPIDDYDLFIINKNQIHTASSQINTPMLRYSVKFLAQVIIPLFEFTDLLSVFRKAGNTIAHKISIPPEKRRWYKRQFEKLLVENGYAWDVKKKLHLCELLIQINELVEEKYNSQGQIVSQKNTRNMIGDLIKYIHQHLSEPLCLDHLAKVSAVSKYHLTRLFKAELGISIHQYIVTHRIGYAVSLLEEGKSMAEISDLTGFGSYANFISTFKKVKGLPPLQYRKQIFNR